MSDTFEGGASGAPPSLPPLDLGRVVIAKPQFVIGRSRKSWARFHHFVAAGAAELRVGGVRRDTYGRSPIDSMVSRLDAIAARHWLLFCPFPSNWKWSTRQKNNSGVENTHVRLIPSRHPGYIMQSSAKLRFPGLVNLVPD